MVYLAFALAAVASLLLLGVINPGPAKQAPFKAYNNCNMASFTVGAKVANVINVAVQLQQANGSPATGSVVEAWLSAAPTGLGLTGTAPTSATAIGTNGTILGVHSNSLTFVVQSNAAGQFDLNITQTATPVAYYLAVQMPDGSWVTSPVIQF